jgi:hypothetical protein
MKNKEVEIIRQATDEATEELEAMDIKYTSGIKDFLVWLDLVKQKLIKYLN